MERNNQCYFTKEKFTFDGTIVPLRITELSMLLNPALGVFSKHKIIGMQ